MNDYSIHSETVKAFDKELEVLIQKGTGCFDETTFNKLALQEFAIQYHNVELYRQLCDSEGVNPATATSWEEIPALPSDYFKKSVIASFPLSETELTLMTSGTSNPNLPGKIYRDKRCVELYYEANRLMAKNYLFPDVERMKILLMVPSPKMSPTMGMAVGLEQLRQNFGTEDSLYLISPDGMEWEMLFDALHEAEETGEPVAIVGATSGLVYFYNFCREQGLHFQLPAGSRICDGGGYFGTFGDCSRQEYLKLCAETLGVPEHYCVNTLGSGESTTNYFDNVLRNHLLGRHDVPRCKECPPWSRTIVVDPATGVRVTKGTVGLLRHCDLINRANVFAVQTNNLGYETDDGFEIIGRTDVKGQAAQTLLNRMISRQPAVCSSVATEMLAAAANTDEQPGVCSTVATEMLATSINTGESTGVCSTVATEMLAESTADGIISGEINPCSMKTDRILAGIKQDPSKAPEVSADMSNEELLTKSPHGKMFNLISKERLEKLKVLCPFLQLQGLVKKA